MIDDCSFAGHDFRDRIREVRSTADERLDDRHLRVAADDNEVARMGPDAVPISDEEKMDEPVNDRAVGNNNQTAILCVGSVQRGERMALVVGVLRVMLFQFVAGFADRGNADARDVRAARHQPAVDENQLRRRVISQRRAARVNTRRPFGKPPGHS